MKRKGFLNSITRWLDRRRRGGKGPATPSAGAGQEYLDQTVATSGQVPRDVVIGVDLGTSCTKVVIRTPFAAGGRAVPVPFGKLGHPTCQFLLPTCLSVGVDRSLNLGTGDSGSVRNHLKRKLLDAALKSDETQKEQAILEATAYMAGYLGLALKYAREWFESEERGAIKGFRPRWQVNIGIPSAGYADEPLKKAFLSAAKAGWYLSLDTGLIETGSAVAAAELALEGELEDEVEINVLPEVAAEVVGYARSPLRRTGLHVIADAGASTLDICGFVLHEHDGDDRYSLLNADVSRLGVVALHKLRRCALCELCSGGFVDTVMEDPVAPIPEYWIDYMVDTECDECANSLKSAEGEFVSTSVQALMGIIMSLKDELTPLASAFQDGIPLPLFLCGGGSFMSQFQEVVDQAGSQLNHLTRVRAQLIRSPLPVPQDLDSELVDKQIFRRLAVAYGLSFNYDDIGTIDPPVGVEPIRPYRQIDWKANYPDKDIE